MAPYLRCNGQKGPEGRATEEIHLEAGDPSLVDGVVEVDADHPEFAEITATVSGEDATGDGELTPQIAGALLGRDS